MAKPSHGETVNMGVVFLSVALAAVMYLAVQGAGTAVIVVVGLVGILAGWIVPLLGKGGEDAPVEFRITAPERAGESPPPAAPKPADADERQRVLVEGELSAAREIQMRLVPHTFPPIPGCPDFDLFATIDPAREIGGDFYDFWLLGRERLAVVMADVSGKGIPAALFMAMTRTYMRAFSRSIHDPGKLLDRLNREVSRHNPGCMFVTVFCGIIDLTTGKVEYANAGHNPPFIKKPGRPAESLDILGDPPIGFLAGMEYQVATVTLEPDDIFLLYTDGFPEANDLGQRELGEERALEIFGEAVDTTCVCNSILMQVRSQIFEYAKGADQYDDITLLAYRHVGDKDWRDSGGSAGNDDSDDAGESPLSSDSVMSGVFDGSRSPTGGLTFDSKAGDQFMSLSDMKGK